MSTRPTECGYCGMDHTSATPCPGPRCAQAMGCLCAAHARGAPTDAPCDTNEAWEPDPTRYVCPEDPTHELRVLRDEEGEWGPDDYPIVICCVCGCDAVPKED
jgi:hypothetical protein